MVGKDGGTIQPTTPAKHTKPPKSESPIATPLFSPMDTMDAIPGSSVEESIDEKVLIDVEYESPMKDPLEAKINDAKFSWSWTDTAGNHATNAALDKEWPVMAPASAPRVVDQDASMEVDTKAKENYSPITKAFSMMTAFWGSKEETKLDTISEEENEQMDTSDEPSQSTSPNINFEAPVNSPTDSALGAPMTVLNSSTMQMSMFQLSQHDSYHTTPSGTAPPSYQTSPRLLPELSQEDVQIGQQPSLLNDISEKAPTLTKSASTMTLTDGNFVAHEEDREETMSILPPNPRPWGHAPTTFLCLPKQLRQWILFNTISIKDFQVQRLRVTVVDETCEPPIFRNHNWNGDILEDYYEAFVFDDKVKAWGKVLEEVDKKVKSDLNGVRREWKELGLYAREMKIIEMDWVRMAGSGWNGKF
ncbi:hypothetical protein FKW77_008720 [Venturia effusa]|uniref:Uncharacterized protein n=1 Tax=Venturia effusa TaxID=50376 RepID=A0A517L9T3_9PEZI|nr:hypothetical protein FKW77_008720 [Venturia effusa]